MPRTGRDRAGSRAAIGLTEPPTVVVEGVSTSYAGERVIEDVSFTVEPSRTLVVMGASGVGKTTLTKTMLGLLEPDEGEVTIGGHDVHDLTPAQLRDLRRGFGVLLGGSSVYDGSVFGSMTAWENVRYSLSARGYDAAVVDERAWQRMIDFGLTDHAGKMPDQLSSGTRRRLALATAFIDSPPLIVLDDPAAAMDTVNRTRIIDAIRAARESTSATMLLTCHDVEMARTLGDDMIVMLEGRVVARGPVAELLDGVGDADSFDERFRFSESFARTDATERSTYHRVADDRGEATSWAWAVYLTLFVMAMATFIALMTGVIDNNFTW